jgi:peptide-methionine (S)-S-oxide reductase
VDELTGNGERLDPSGLQESFRQAVAAVDAGDVEALRRLLDARPQLVSERLDEAPAWLREQIGDAADGFFARPYLLWFTAEDPLRNGRLPDNISEVMRTIIEAARREQVPSLAEQLDSTLQLVCWSGVAASSGLQPAMIDALLDAGASPAANADNALVNRHLAAAEHLVARGGVLTFAAALCLDRWDEVPRLAAAATPGARQFALVLAALNGKAAAVKWLLDSGAPVNEPSPDLYSHGTPLHHAVCSGSLDTVEVLIGAGADPTRMDTAWHATPLDWAEHYRETAAPGLRDRYTAIASYLRARASS